MPWLVSGHPQADSIVYTFQNETIQVFFLLLLESTGGKQEEITQILTTESRKDSVGKQAGWKIFQILWRILDWEGSSLRRSFLFSPQTRN